VIIGRIDVVLNRLDTAREEGIEQGRQEGGVVYTWRDETPRLISARKATQQEEAQYA